MVVTPSARMLAWYGERKRDLPWRRSRDPYAIWLSEIMLQQTRVETVIPYYQRFLKTFPTVAKLAQASEEEVLVLWSGLGYYRRARFLHKAARQVVDEGGRLPQTFSDWRRLPGVGDYTAAAISSIAFGELEPVLDGNVERVLARRFLIDGPLRSAVRKRELRELARQFLDPERAGDSNQAMMELGATVCTPRSPNCGACPLARDCVAGASGVAEEYPHKAAKRAKVNEQRTAAVAVRDGRYLLFRRAEGAELLAGMWEFPWCLSVVGGDERRLESRLSESYGGSWQLSESLGTVRHAITFRSIRVEVKLAEVTQTEAVAEGPEAAWVSRSDLEQLPISSLVKKILARFVNAN